MAISLTGAPCDALASSHTRQARAITRRPRRERRERLGRATSQAVAGRIARRDRSERCESLDLEAELARQGSRRRTILDRYVQMLAARAGGRAFHPYGGQQVLRVGEGVLALRRTSPDEDRAVLCLHNLRRQPQVVRGVQVGAAMWDLLNGERVPASQDLVLKPYQARWLQEEGESDG